VTTPEESLAAGGEMVRPAEGHYFVAVRVRIRNVGKWALCATLRAKLKEEFGLEDPTIIGITPAAPNISRLLPGEETEGNCAFMLKNGVRALELMLEPTEYSEACRGGRESEWPLRLIWTDKVRFVLKEISPSK
jgi:hypothetical protein